MKGLMISSWYLRVYFLFYLRILGRERVRGFRVVFCKGTQFSISFNLRNFWVLFYLYCKFQSSIIYPWLLLHIRKIPPYYITLIIIIYWEDSTLLYNFDCYYVLGKIQPYYITLIVIMYWERFNFII